MGSKFTDWKCRASALGNIMTSLPSKEDIEKTKAEIKILEDEKRLGVNTNGNKVKWTENKAEKLTALKLKLNTKDELPTGAKSFLDKEFRNVFWKRRRLLQNKQLDKGNIGEDDGLGLISHLDDVFYIKNKDHFENEYLSGTPDNVQGIVRDIKCNWDLETFDSAELTKLYEWQIKAYLWLTKLTEGELCYCLVNNPVHQLINEKNSLIYKLGNPSDEDERWINAVTQVERNMVFDIQKFKDDNPGYDFENKVLDFDIPTVCRVKTFSGIKLFPEDVKNITTRVELAREYLIVKEQKVIEQISNEPI